MADVLSLTGADVGTLALDTLPYVMARPGWAPAVAKRRDDEMGGRGPFIDVVESIPLVIIGTTKAEADGALEDLVSAIDQADRWREDMENVTAVQIRFATSGGNTMRAAVLGSRNLDKILELRPNYRVARDGSVEFIIGPFNLKLLRSGQWLAGGESEVTSSAVANPGIMTASLADSHEIPSPLEVRISTFDKTRTPVLSPGYLVVTNDEDKIYLNEAEDATESVTGTDTFADVSDATASGGDRKDFIPNEGNQGSLAFGVGTFPASVKRFAMLIAAFNDSAAITYRVWYDLVSPGLTITSRKVVTIPAGMSGPVIFHLGFVAHPWIGVATAHLYVQPSAAGGSGDGLQVDYMVTVGLGDDTDRIIKFEESDPGSIVSDYYLHFDHKILERPSPQVYLSQADVDQTTFPAYRGTPYISTKGDEVAAILLNPEGANWTYNTKANMTLRAIRNKGYLVIH